MAITYSCRVCDAFGQLQTTISNFIAPVDGGGSALDFVLNVGKSGSLTLTVPASINPDFFKPDGRIGVYRSINGRPPVLDGETVFLIRRFEYTDRYTQIVARSANSILERRIAAYDAGTSYTNKSATAADNLIKTVVSENFGSGIVGADRDGVETQADVSSYLTIQANLGLGQSIAKAFTRRNIATVVQELCEASTTAGTYLAAEIVAPSETTLELRTYATQRGVDHRASSGQPVIFSPARGNLENVKLVVDHTDEVTFVVAGGSNTGANRIIATAVDTTRMGVSPFGRIEQFLDMTNVSDSAQLQDEADAALRNARPRISFDGDIVETPVCIRGIHFDIGDMVTAAFRNQQYDCRLDVVHVTLGAGQQTSRAQFRSVT